MSFDYAVRVGIAVVLCASNIGWAAVHEGSLEIRLVALSGPEYTSSGGQLFSAGGVANSSGQVVGAAQKYAGGSPSGMTGWVYNYASDSLTPADIPGGPWGVPAVLTEGGLAYFGVNNNAAYVYDLATGVETSLGLTDSIHTHTDGHRDSDLGGVRGEFAYGQSQRYTGIVTSAWVYNPTIGETRFAGIGSVQAMNQNGFAVGQTSFDTGSQLQGWYYDPVSNSSVRIGLTGDPYRSTSGPPGDSYEVTQVRGINSSGLAIGFSDRWSGGDRGSDAWSYNPTTQNYTLMGLTDVVHTAPNGMRSASALFVNDAGVVLGSNRQYNNDGHPTSDRTAWVYSPSNGQTMALGLIDGEHTDSNGGRNSRPTGLTNAGYALGVSSRYSGANELDQTPWVSNTITGDTIKLGIHDSEHTWQGRRTHSIVDMLETGYVLGTTEKRIPFSPSVSILTYTGWLFDPTTDTMHVLESPVPEDPDAFFRPLGLLEDGTVVGLLNLADTRDVYFWNVETGYTSLDSRVAESFDDLGLTNWGFTSSGLTRNGYLVGKGNLPDGSTTAFVIGPAVPEPGSLLLLTIGGAVMLRRR